jgi:hypothetical protein
MVPAVQALLLAVLALLTPPSDGAGRAPARRGEWVVSSPPGRPDPVTPGVLTGVLPAQGGGHDGWGKAGEDEDEAFPHARPAWAPAPFALAPPLGRGDGASAHPSFHSVPRPLFLLCGRWNC